MYRTVKRLFFAIVSMVMLLVSCSNDDFKNSEFIQLVMPGEGGSQIITSIEKFYSYNSSTSRDLSYTDYNFKSSAEWCVVFKNPEKGGGFTVMVEKNPSTKESRIANVVMVTKTYPERRSCVLSVFQSPADIVTEKPNGKLPGKFSVSATKQVCFSQGNLQYQASTKTWRFAECQYDIVGADNSKISSYNSGWIDLFCWGTSGYNEMFPPYMTYTNSNFGDGTTDISGTKYDWGVYNAIGNGGNKAGMWRTLTKEEWTYLLDTRTDAHSLRFYAKVNGVDGIVLLPDGRELPSDLTPQDNGYSKHEWSEMESLGAVFLPSAGYRENGKFYNDYYYHYYWSSTSCNSEGYSAYFLDGDSGCVLGYWNDSNSKGYSVRLVSE